MNRLLSFISCLWLAFAASAAFASGDNENGGIIIFRAHYTVSMDDTCGTLVIVTSDKEVASMRARIESSEGPLTFRLKNSSYDMKLKPRDQERLIGRMKDGRRVMVVTRAYAEKHGMY